MGNSKLFAGLHGFREMVKSDVRPVVHGQRSGAGPGGIAEHEKIIRAGNLFQTFQERIVQIDAKLQMALVLTGNHHRHKPPQHITVLAALKAPEIFFLRIDLLRKGGIGLTVTQPLRRMPPGRDPAVLVNKDDVVESLRILDELGQQRDNGCAVLAQPIKGDG